LTTSSARLVLSFTSPHIKNDGIVMSSASPGILAYSVSSRQREIGVRMALGASRFDVLRIVLRQGMVLVAIGVSVGLAISLLVGRAFSSMLFGLNPSDPLSLLGASAVLLLVAALACYLPALAASRMDPMQALRDG
jgi:ABC-type antimicrobial peptide transport system permease subunit